MKKLKFDELSVEHMKTMLRKVKKEVEGEDADSMGMYMQSDEVKPPVDWTGKLPREIDLVSNRMKMKQLRDGIKRLTDKLIDSKPIVPWKYTGEKDKVEAAFQVNHVPGFVKKVAAVDSDEEDSLDSDEKKPKDRTKLYDRDISEIRKFPWKFKYDEKELDDEEVDDDDDDFPQLENAPGKRNKKQNNNFQMDEASEMTPDDTIEVDFDFLK